MKLEGKCCKPANEIEYDLMKAVALAAGYELIPEHVGYGEGWVYRITNDCLFAAGNNGKKITIHDWVFKATHKDTGELVVPEWASEIHINKFGVIYFIDSLGNNSCRIDGEFGPHDYEGSQLLLTRQSKTNSEQSWHERGELPPVGEKCQYDMTCDDGYADVLIIGTNTRGQLVFELIGEPGCYFNDDNPRLFRPLQPKPKPLTDEQIEAVREFCDFCSYQGDIWPINEWLKQRGE